MSWLFDNYKWLFDGVGGAAVVALIAYLIQRLFRAKTETTRENRQATVKSQESPAIGLAAVSVSHNIQTVNAPTIHAQTVNFGHSPTPPLPEKEAAATQKPRVESLPNVRYLGAETVCLQEEISRGLFEGDLSPNAFLIRFANEPRPDAQNLSARVRAVMIYRYQQKEIDIVGSWLYESSDVSEFEPDSRRHKLIAGILTDGQLAAITGENFVAHRRNWYRSDARPLKGFQTGTLFVQLTSVPARRVLYEDTFALSLNPLKISLQSQLQQPARMGIEARVTAGNLEMVFGGDRKPYLEEQATGTTPGGVLRDRRYRIGIRNKGSATVHHVRVVLENCEPSEHDGIHLNHALHFMDTAPGTSEFSIAPADEPSSFVDVVYDETLAGKLRGDAFGICYASPVRTFAIPRGTYVLTLRMEGDGTVSRKQLKIYQNPLSQMLAMREFDPLE